MKWHWSTSTLMQQVCTSVKCHSSRQSSQKLQTRNKSTSFVSIDFHIILKCFSSLLTLSLSFLLLCSVPQNAPPTIVFKKRQFYIGEKLVANCTTSRSKPVPHITWLINGKKVNIWIDLFTLSPPRPPQLCELIGIFIGASRRKISHFNPGTSKRQSEVE